MAIACVALQMVFKWHYTNTHPVLFNVPLELPIDLRAIYFLLSMWIDNMLEPKTLLRLSVP